MPTLYYNNTLDDSEAGCAQRSRSIEGSVREGVSPIRRTDVAIEFGANEGLTPLCSIR